MDDLARAGLVVLDSFAYGNWQTFAKQLSAVVSERHRGISKYREIGTLDTRDWALLRADLYAAAPGLEEFVGRVGDLMNDACGVFIPRVGLEALSTNDRAAVAYAIAACIGNPTATDKKQVVWDVKPREGGHASTYFSTFSETDAEAAFHTDTQYYAEPEPLFCLYVMQEDSRGDGLSSALDARALRSSIEKWRPALAEFLKTAALPFRIPTAFSSDPSDPDLVEATLAPIFDDVPLIRYRKDTLNDGMKAFPKFITAESVKALEAFEQEIQACENQVQFFMPRDSMCVMNNHECLHARTAFTDPERHLLRIRMRSSTKPASTKKYTLLQRHDSTISA